MEYGFLLADSYLGSKVKVLPQKLAKVNASPNFTSTVQASPSGSEILGRLQSVLLLTGATIDANFSEKIGGPELLRKLEMLKTKGEGWAGEGGGGGVGVGVGGGVGGGGGAVHVRVIEYISDSPLL